MLAILNVRPSKFMTANNLCRCRFRTNRMMLLLIISDWRSQRLCHGLKSLFPAVLGGRIVRFRMDKSVNGIDCVNQVFVIERR